MKTADLSGPALDYWVAKAEGFDAEIVRDEKGAFCVRTETFENGGKARGPYSPSTEWHRGGPIIEGEKIATMVLENEWRAFVVNAKDTFGSYYDPSYWLFELTTQNAAGSGSTLLVAAMRAYVSSKFGEEVENNPTAQ